MTEHAIGWSDCRALARKMGELQPELVHYVVGRTGDDYMLRVQLMALRDDINTVLQRSERTNASKPGRVIFPRDTI